jgi:hypothetical protein
VTVPTFARWILGLSVCVLAVSPASAGSPTEGSFLALTYNVAGLPQGISGGDPTTNSPLISPRLNSYDLVLLQEDWGDPLGAVPLFFHEEIVAEADHPYRSEPAPAPMGTDLRRFPTGPPLIADGLNRLSRFPFDAIRRVMWNTCYGEFAVEAADVILGAAGLSGPIDDAGLSDVVSGGAADCGAQKGFAVARTKFADGVEVDVYNLHGEAGGGPQDEDARAAGFVQLADYIQENSAGRGVILGGDTNLHTEPDPDNAEDIRVWEKFQADTGLSDVCRVADCGDDAGVIDKFAFRSGGGIEILPLSHNFERERFTRGDGEPLSDHDPLAVRFRWRIAGSVEGADPELPFTGGASHLAGLALLLAAVIALCTMNLGRMKSRTQEHSSRRP